MSDTNSKQMEKSRKELIIAIVIALLIVLFLLKKCSIDDRSRENFRRDRSIGNHLYVETYCVFGQGAFGTDLVSDWLTDKSNFRIYIGTYDEGRGGFRLECKDSTVYVRECLYDDNDHFIKESLVDVYNIAGLKKLQNFKDN